jgi:hypothetical protein
LQDKKNNVIDALRYSHEGARKATASRPKPTSEPVAYPSGAGAWMVG